MLRYSTLPSCSTRHRYSIPRYSTFNWAAFRNSATVLTLTVLLLTLLTLLLQPAYAAKPVKPPAAPAPEVYAVKIDYTGNLILVSGQNLDPASASAEVAGVALTPEPASSDTLLLFAFTPALATAVDELGNYVINISTSGGTFTLSAFIPFALVIAPEPPPPGPDCPCSPEWDDKSTTASPNGFSGQTPYCSEDTSSFVTVQFYDIPANNYWVLWTQWSGSAGYCELYIDGPKRTLNSEDQFNSCAGYLRNIVTVWGDQGNACIF